MAQRISGFEQKLCPDKHREVAKAYLRERPDVSMDDLEHTVWPCLVMNLETCLNLIDRTRDFQTSHLLREGLIGRYTGVNAVLSNLSLLPAQQADIGADTILVFPTLAYFVMAWAEMIHPMNLRPVIDDGTLHSALHDAALLTRLLNDLGSLAVQPVDDLAAIIDVLKSQATGDHAGQTLGELLESNMKQYGPLLARLHKDIVHHEFNVSLNGLLGDLPLDSAVDIFGRRVTELADLYHQANERLQVTLGSISESLADESVSHLIRQFVEFHQMLYGHPHTELSGDYTV
jgi:hypothetical protein